MSISGLRPGRNRTELARRIGVVFGQRTQLWWDLPAGEGFRLLRHIYGVEEGAFRRRLDHLVQCLAIEDLLGVPVRQLSFGHRFLRSLNRDQGTTVLMTSHDLDDIEQLCRRVMVIDRGRFLHDGDLGSLWTRFGHERRLVLQLRGLPQGAPFDLPAGARIRERRGLRLVLAFDSHRIRAPDLVRDILARYDVADLEVHEARIEDVVKRIYRGH